MNSYRPILRPRGLHPHSPIRYTTKRLSSLLVAIGAIVAIVMVSRLEAAGASSPLVLAVGLVLFIVAAAVAASAIANGVATMWTYPARRTQDDRSSGLPGSSLRDWARGSQLGPDPEQVVSRHTGARA
jgi:hypothetical protein